MHIGIQAFFILLAGGGVIAAAPAQDISNADCIQRLRLPTYPPLAVLARIAGDVTVRITVGEAGSVGEVRTGKAHPLLANSVRAAIKGSTFLRTCADREIVLQFKFVIEGKGTDYPTAPEISFESPNTFWIVSPPRTLQP